MQARSDMQVEAGVCVSLFSGPVALGLGLRGGVQLFLGPGVQRVVIEVNGLLSLLHTHWLGSPSTTHTHDAEVSGCMWVYVCW